MRIGLPLLQRLVILLRLSFSSNKFEWDNVPQIWIPVLTPYKSNSKDKTGRISSRNWAGNVVELSAIPIFWSCTQQPIYPKTNKNKKKRIFCKMKDEANTHSFMMTSQFFIHLFEDWTDNEEARNSTLAGIERIICTDICTQPCWANWPSYTDYQWASNPLPYGNDCSCKSHDKLGISIWDSHLLLKYFLHTYRILLTIIKITNINLHIISKWDRLYSVLNFRWNWSFLTEV